MGGDILGHRWYDILGDIGGIWFVYRFVRYWIDKCRDRRDRKRYYRGLRNLKWEQQRERLREQHWRDDIGRLD